MKSILYANSPWSFEISLIPCEKHLHLYFTDEKAVSTEQWRSSFLSLATVLDNSWVPDFSSWGNCTISQEFLAARQPQRRAGDPPVTLALDPLVLLKVNPVPLCSALSQCWDVQRAKKQGCSSLLWAGTPQHREHPPSRFCVSGGLFKGCRETKMIFSGFQYQRKNTA